MGFRPSKEELKDILEEIDEDGSGKLDRSRLKKCCMLCAFHELIIKLSLLYWNDSTFYVTNLNSF